jgi:uracil-DNA glycosylase family 4
LVPVTAASASTGLWTALKQLTVNLQPNGTVYPVRTNLFNEPLSSKGSILGCSACPLNEIPGVVKIQGLTRIKSRRAFLWAQSPGSRETEKGLELVGPSGRLVWDTFKLFGLERDSFDLQNICRCQPLDAQGEEHPPTKRELECCSVFNDRALELNRGKAVVHLILGDVAGQQLLGGSLKKDKPVFWYAPWDAYVVYAQHPAYILRKGGVDAGFDYLQWKAKLGAVKAILDNPGRFGYLKSQDHNTVRTLKEFDAMEREIRLEAKLRRVAFDIEDDKVDGKRIILLAGFGIGHYQNHKDDSSWVGKSWSVVLEHPESGYSPKLLQDMKDRVRVLCEDASIKKTLQNGSYDAQSVKETLGTTLRGFDYDTRYGTYLRFSFMRSFSLENLTYLFFPEFGDYKSIVDPYQPHFSTAPLDLLVHRNCGDCDITQRLEQKFSHEVRAPLVKVYVHAGNTLDKMEKRGPCLDLTEWNKAAKIVPKLIQKLNQQLQQIAEDPNFECSSPEQVGWLLYDKLELPTYEESKRSTRADVLDRLQAETKDSSIILIIDLVRAHRTLSKIASTYLDNYKTSAELHGGELRTRWFLTGAVTGRLRSGGEGTKGLVNFQNLAGEKLVQNMLVSDRNWRKAME